jgi:hypothetical protein
VEGSVGQVVGGMGCIGGVSICRMREASALPKTGGFVCVLLLNVVQTMDCAPIETPQRMPLLAVYTN